MNQRQRSACLLLLSGAALAATLHAQVVAAPSQSVSGVMVSPQPFELQRPAPAQHLHLSAGQSVVLKTRTPIKRVYIGDPSVLESFNSGDQEMVLTAKSSGSSGLIFWDNFGNSYVYSISVDIDANMSRDSLQAAFPGSKISVESREGRVILTGDVDSQAISEGAFRLVSTYSKEVVNALHVAAPHEKQVRLKLRIVEVDRAKAEQFGFNFMTAGRTASSVSTQQFANNVDTSPISQGMPIKVSDPFNIFAYNYKLALGLTLKDLEQKQILQVLAEPTLTTMSGVSARFLSGGEFPVPVVQGTSGSGTSVSIVYKPYGVKVDFTPTVNRDGTIHLKVTPEVSALDYTNAVTLSGTTVPALSTRRAETEVEIRNGESFVISGLLDHRLTDAFLPHAGHCQSADSWPALSYQEPESRDGRTNGAGNSGDCGSTRDPGKTGRTRNALALP